MFTGAHSPPTPPIASFIKANGIFRFDDRLFLEVKVSIEPWERPRYSLFEVQFHSDHIVLQAMDFDKNLLFANNFEFSRATRGGTFSKEKVVIEVNNRPWAVGNLIASLRPSERHQSTYKLRPVNDMIFYRLRRFAQKNGIAVIKKPDPKEDCEGRLSVPLL